MAPPATRRRTTRAAAKAEAAQSAAQQAAREPEKPGDRVEGQTREQAEAEPKGRAKKQTGAEPEEQPAEQPEEQPEEQPAGQPEEQPEKQPEPKLEEQPKKRTGAEPEPEPEAPQRRPGPAPLPVEPSAEEAARVGLPGPKHEPEPEHEPEGKMAGTAAEDAAAKTQERMARFKALRARAKASSETNLKEATRESQRLATDPSQLTALHRKHAIASHKLLQADVEEAGEDFERKRAWDWTVDESQRWDKRLKKKAAHRDNNAFQDHQQESNKVYKRQLRNIKTDLEHYDRQKMAAIERAAASGGLDIVEMDDGELIAVDKDGSFYSTADSTAFAQNKPDKAAVDRLVEDLKRADEQRLKKRRERMAKNGDDGDVTYINEKNKQFNQKLARFYDKYTADIRDSFERGTMI